METLFDKKLPIDRLGSRNILIGGAKAFFPIEPYFYFLIDRDHHSDLDVEDYWRKFPVANEPNILIWRRKELENYLIDPDLFCTSSGVKASKDEVTSRLLEIVQSSLYFDTARLIVSEIRSDFEKWGNQVWKEFNQTKSSHINASKSIEYLSDIIKQLETPQFIKISTLPFLNVKYHEKLNIMTGGADSIQIGKGRWLELIQGKLVFDKLFSEFFKMPKRHNTPKTPESLKHVSLRQFSNDIVNNGELLHSDIVDVKKKITNAILSFPA